MRQSNRSVIKLLGIASLALVLASCSFSRQQSGGYYQDDGPGTRRVDLSKIPDAVPKNEPFHSATSRPYKIRGKRYVPLRSNRGFRQEGFASWYGKKYHGRKTSNGETYDMYAMTAAHPILPIPSYVRVTNLSNYRSVVVRVNDRGPFIGNRIIDLSYVAAQKLGVVTNGTAKVRVESVFPETVNQTVPVPSDNHNAVLTSRPYVERGEGIIRQEQPLTQSVATNQVPPAGRWLQTGAFSIQTNAEKIKQRLSNDGFSSQIIRSGSLYKVVVGPLSPSATVVMQQRLQRLGYSVSLFKGIP